MIIKKNYIYIINFIYILTGELQGRIKYLLIGEN